MSNYTTAHYDSFDYIHTLTEKEKEVGQIVIRIDPYFVSNQWKLGSKDESGVLFHNLKTIARFGYKNAPEREIRALIVQSLALARINKVDINDLLVPYTNALLGLKFMTKAAHEMAMASIIQNLDDIINSDRPIVPTLQNLKALQAAIIDDLKQTK